MSECNNDCVFCCVRDERSSSTALPLQTVQEVIRSQPVGSVVDFFGGEPTLYPHFLEALKFANECGHFCHIATNGRPFASLPFTKKVLGLGVKQIRTSLYGHTHELHDYHTDSPGSFEETLGGIANISACDVELIVNMVMTERNYPFLNDMLDLLVSVGVQNVKFASLENVENCAFLVPRMSDVRPRLAAVLERCDLLGLESAVEKSPLCLVPQFCERFVCDWDPILYRKPAPCRTCVAAKHCSGVSKEHLSLYGTADLIPLTSTEYSCEMGGREKATPVSQLYSSIGTSITAIMKVTNLCNLDCAYCYYGPNRNDRKGRVMSRELISKVIRELLALPFNRVDFNWHGGEPLLVGKDLLEFALECQRHALRDRRDLTVVNRIQTNGTLLDTRWIDLAASNDIRVGVSLDGPLGVHDAHRRYTTGEGSFEDVMQGLKALNNAGLDSQNILVISQESLSRVEEIYALLKEYAPSFDILPCFHIDQQSRRLLYPSVSPSQFSAFAIQLFDLWFSDDDPAVCIRFFDEALQVLLGGCANLCSLKRGCAGFITVEPNGDVYPCDSFAQLPEFRLGSASAQSLGTILYSDARRRFERDATRGTESCRVCEWYQVCRGGCAYHGYAANGTFGAQNPYCGVLRAIFSHLDRALATSLPHYTRYAERSGVQDTL